MLALPIALLILVVVFGTFVAAWMPLLLAIVSVPVAFALLYPVAAHTQISTYVLSVASIVGLGIAIDYSLFIVRRYREELALGLSRAEAMGWTLATAGEAILFSGLIVMMGFVALLLIGIPITTSVGLGGIFIVFSAVLGALTFLPALLCVLGTRINALRVPLSLAYHDGNGCADERPPVWWASGQTGAILASVGAPCHAPPCIDCLAGLRDPDRVGMADFLVTYWLDWRHLVTQRC